MPTPDRGGISQYPNSMGMALVLLGTALIIGWRRSPSLGATLIGYALLQLAYNLGLKRTVILDIIAIATGLSHERMHTLLPPVLSCLPGSYYVQRCWRCFWV